MEIRMDGMRMDMNMGRRNPNNTKKKKEKEAENGAKFSELLDKVMKREKE
jgi:hypothetical protein